MQFCFPVLPAFTSALLSLFKLYKILETQKNFLKSFQVSNGLM
jgi:hypothetical protein